MTMVTLAARPAAMVLLVLGLAVGLVGLAVGCDGQDETESAAAGGAGGAVVTGGAVAAGGDESDECAAAVVLEPLTNTLGGLYYEHHGALDPAGDRDSFRFDAEAGQWFAMMTHANPVGDPSQIDTVLTLLDGQGAHGLAQSDDAASLAGRDSIIVHRFAQSGSYCVQVSEHADSLGNTPVGGPDFTYRLRLFPVDFEAYDDWNLDAEPNDGAGGSDSGQELSLVNYDWWALTRIAGRFGAPADVDVYRFHTGPLAEALTVAFWPSGPTGNGASTGPGLVRLRRDDGSVIAELDYQSTPSAEEYLFDARLVDTAIVGMVTDVEPEQAVLLEVAPPAGSNPGEDDFYVFALATVPYGIIESEPNDDPVNASYRTRADPLRPGVTIYDIAGRLPVGDVDWWVTDNIGLGTTIELHCASWQLGSSLRDATFELYPPKCDDETGTCHLPTAEPLQAQTETEHEAVRWSDDPQLLPAQPAVEVEVEGAHGWPHYFRVSATQYEPGIESVYYACRLVTISP